MENWNIENICNKSGIYIFKNKNKIIYVGKAKNLKNRIKQYKSGSTNSFKTKKMIKEATNIEFIITQNEKEALILERNLIKEHSPYFNIQFIDDKKYPYLKIILKKDLKIQLVRNYKKDDSFYFGPLPAGSKSRQLFKILERESLYENGLPIKNKDINFWKEKYEKVKKILSKDNSFFKKELKEKMLKAADKELFELALEYKDSLEALKVLEENQSVQLNKNKNIDVLGIEVENDYIFISIMFYRNGNLLSIKNKLIEIITDTNETIRQFIESYYEKNLIPNELIIDKKYNNEFTQKIKIINPIKGTYKKMLENANLNAINNKEEKVRKYKRKTELSLGAIEKLGILLKIKTPKTILMIDNSNTYNQNPVSAIVYYENGLKQKSKYKKYNLEINKKRKADVEYMHQAIKRYFLNKENKIPDLFIVDGSQAQINEAKKVIKKLKIKLNIIGLVKNEKHITKSLIDLNQKEQQIKDIILLNFLREMQTEVDRFAKAQHRTRALKGTLIGTLETIEGIGEKTATKLLKQFKTYSNIYNATTEELSKIVPIKIAKKIKEKLK